MIDKILDSLCDGEYHRVDTLNLPYSSDTMQRLLWFLSEYDFIYVKVQYCGSHVISLVMLNPTVKEFLKKQGCVKQ